MCSSLLELFDLSVCVCACVCVCVCVCVSRRTSAALSGPDAESHLLRMTTYDLQMPTSETTRCMKNETAGKLNMSLGNAHTGLLTTNWIGEVFVTHGTTGT
jgi:hypothetical protein